MKKIYVVIALVATTVWLHAQITVTNATFPVAGDTLKFATDLDPDGVVITAPGGPTAWDFTGLAPTFKSETVFSAASGGVAFAQFPNAELLSISGGGQNETYYDVSATNFDNLGFSGADPNSGFPVQTTFKFSPPVPARRAPLNFIDNHLASTSVNVAFSLADIPGGVLDSLGIPTALVDSIRIRVTASRVDIVDAYGTLAIPGGTYDVLREKRSEYRETRLDIHTFFGWIDVTDQAGAAAGFGLDTLITYNFFSNTEKEPIAVVEMDNSGSVVQQVDYKDTGVVSGNNDVAAIKPEVVVSPNPATDLAVFELKNFKPGSYSIQLLDARGSLILVKNLTTGNIAVSLEGLAEGAYFYRLLDDKNRVQSSGKLLKINR